MRSLSRLLPVAFVALPFLACSSEKDHALRNAAPEAQGRHPDYASMTQDQLKRQCISTDAGYPQADLMNPVCATPDPGSKVINCAKAIDDEHFEYAWTWDLHTGKAAATYTYDDNTTAFIVPSRTLGWEPPSDPVENAAALCSPPVAQVPFDVAVRFKGGPFKEYGGGFGQSFHTITNPPLPNLKSSDEYPGVETGAYDLRTWTGIAIWVRRGPLGMSTLRVGLTEKHSSEDLNSGAIKAFAEKNSYDATGIEEGKYCSRWRICGCAAGTPCTPVLIPGTDPPRYNHYCFDPALGTPSEFSIYTVQSCGVTRCSDPNTSTMLPDPLFAKPDPAHAGELLSACNEALQDDGHVDSFCWDPALGDPKPPAKRQRCNNPFSRPITVTTDWQLVRVPFTELRQADEANVANDMDLDSVKQIVFTYGGGWTDFWIANVGFYRAK